MIIFVVVGRLGKSLTVSKVMPFLATGKVSKVYVFRQEEGFPIPNTEYITLPRWIFKIKPAFLSKLFRFIYEPWQLYRYTRKYKPTLINGVFTLPKGLNATIVGLFTKTPSVVSVIGGVVEITTRGRFKKQLEKVNLWMLRKCTAVTTKGYAVDDYIIKKGIPQEKIFTLNGSINTDKFRYNPEVNKDIDILFVGTFRRLKGPDRVLRVVQALKKDFPEIRAVFLGDGYLFNEIRQMVTEFGLGVNVQLLGHVDDTVSWFQRSKCLLMPSSSEGLPTAMLEAMACGCVPVVSNVGNIRVAAYHQKNAMLIENYRDVDTFTSYTHKLLENNTLRQQMAKEAIKTVYEHYTPTKQAQIVNTILTILNLESIQQSHLSPHKEH